MFRLVQVDPESLVINVNAGAMAAHTHADSLFEFLDRSSIHGPFAALEDIDQDSDSFPTELMFGSSLLHEYRHYLDLGFTPFGFYRQRTAHEFYVNFPTLMFGHNGAPIPVPLMSGMDPVTRVALDIGNEFVGSPAYQIGRTALSRVRVINAENAPYSPSGSFRPGGDRILEALAYLAQFECIIQQERFRDHRSYFMSFFEMYTGSAFDLAYRWFTPIVHQLHPGEALPNNRLMSAILFASLCGHIPVQAKVRRGHVSDAPFTDRDVSSGLPSVRFCKLVEDFISKPQSSLSSDDEAFHVVDQACRRLFSRTIDTEIELDIAHTEERLLALKEHRDGLSKAIKHFDVSPHLEMLNKQRSHLLRLFKEMPHAFTSSHLFYEGMSRVIRPPIIYNFPQGLDASSTEIPSKLRKGWIGLIDRTYPVAFKDKPDEIFPKLVIYAFWSPIRGEDGYENGIDDVKIDPSEQKIEDEYLASKQTLYGIYAPLLRWMLYANKYRTMLEVENESITEALGLDSCHFVIDPMYEEANDISHPDLFMEFYSDRICRCDVCNTEVTRDTGFLVSSRTVRQNTPIMEYYREYLPDLVFDLFHKDWSGWMLCEQDMKRFGFPMPSRAPGQIPPT